MSDDPRPFAAERRFAAVTDSHRCLTGPACRKATIVDEVRTAALTADPDSVCDACQDHIEDCCRQLPEDWAQLEDALGDRQSGATDLVRSTPSPAIPIDTTAEQIMAAIVEVADRAAAMVSDRLGCMLPSDRRRVLPKARSKDDEGNVKLVDAKPASLAARSVNRVKPDDWHQLTANIRLVTPNVDVLCRAPKQDVMVWDRSIEDPTTWYKFGPGRYLPINGHGRAITEQSGVDVALEICRVHRATRNHLGRTRLRQRYAMPCPHVDKHGLYCGAQTVGRDDGADRINCTTCGASWPQDEYDFLAGLTAEEIIGQHYPDPAQRLEAYRMLKWLLAESYWRDDQIRVVLDKLANADHVAGFEELDLPGAGRIIYEAIDKILAGHPRPENRNTAA